MTLVPCFINEKKDNKKDDLFQAAKSLLKAIQLKDNDPDEILCLLVQYSLCRLFFLQTKEFKERIQILYIKYWNCRNLLGIFEPEGLAHMVHFLLKYPDFLTKLGSSSFFRLHEFDLDLTNFPYYAKRFLLGDDSQSWSHRYIAELELTWNAHQLFELDYFFVLNIWLPLDLVKIIFLYWNNLWISFYKGVLYDPVNEQISPALFHYQLNIVRNDL